MSQTGDSLQTTIASSANCIVLEVEADNIENKTSEKVNQNVLSHGAKPGGCKCTGEISIDTDKNSAILSLHPASVSCIQESILEKQETIVIGTENCTLESSVQGDSIHIQDLNTILSSKDAKVMFISPDGTIVFNRSELSSDTSENVPIILDPGANPMASITASDTTLNSNYLVMVENIDGSQVLSTSMHRNLLLSSGSGNPISNLSPQAHISFTTVENNEDGSKLRNVADYTESTITMVLDSASTHLNSKEIIMEPNSLITYSDQTAVTSDQLTFHSVTDMAELSTAHLYESKEGSFIDISSLNVVSSDTPSSTTVHHTPTTQAALFKAHSTQTFVMQNEHTPIKSQIQKSILKPTTAGEDSAAKIVILKNNSNTEQEETEVEQVKKDKLKQELRYLEQCHLEHHLKQVQRKQSDHTAVENETEENEVVTELEQNEEIISDTEADQLDKEGIDDQTPIFSTVTATLNSTILAHVPGCQQFLLNKAQENSSYGFDIEFTSDKDCMFSGTLKSLVILHNILKNVINLRSKTLLEFRSDKSKHSSLDKAVMCDLLKPYISLRGRQPKCSLKAAEMGFVNDIDMYLQTDSTVDVIDEGHEKSGGSEEDSPKYKRKRKRGRYNRGVKSKVKKIKVKYLPHMKNNTGDIRETSPKDLTSSDDKVEGKDGAVDKSITNEEGKKNAVNSGETDLIDPLQQRLREEQLRYRKIVNQKQRQMSSVFEVGVSLDVATLPNTDVKDELQNLSDTATAAPELCQENASASDMKAVGRPKRGRPRKAYNHLSMREKVHARNPLTESAATKQQRNYEEQVSFKFFCHQCSFKTKRHSHFVSHMRCHKDGTEKKYTCKQCDFVTISIPMLKRHELKHSESLFKCGICAAYTTNRQELLRRHFRMKHCIEQRELLKGKLNCDQCRYSCLTSEELERHKSVHDRLNQVPNGDILNCPECKKTFRSRMHLQRHIRDVHGPEVRPHLCDKCGKAFKRTDALQQHKLVHMSRTARSFPFKCTSCEKGFRSPAHLKEHMSMHSSERPFLCQYCGAAFKTQPVQKKHILTLHIKPRAHVCSVCCRQFNTKHALQRHENTHTKPDSATEAAVLSIERENAMAEKEATIREKSSTLTNTDNQTTSLSVSESTQAALDGQISGCLVHDVIGTGTTTIEEPLEQSGQTLQQAYIQGTQDGTLYYFTGELPTL